ncbi:MAG: IS3 family transposase [Gemmatimonadales bacterium]|nr:IS3 family transposase [Gemmatimonadales bacterium]
MTAAQRRAVVAEMRDRRAVSERQACRYLGWHRTPVRYQARRAPQTALVARLRELAATKVRWGSPRLTWRLVRDGWPVNHKRIERLMREEQLLVRQRPRRKRAAMARVPTPVPTRPDQRWSMDFVRDTLLDGRPFRVWTVVDDATRECPWLLVERSLPAVRIVEALEMLRLVRGLPHVLVCDNGPEFVSQAMDHWAETRSVTLDFIRPGRPVENCFIESFNGRLRDECLNIHHFRTLAEARTVIEAWRTEYNTDRPHSGLGQRTPAEFAAQFQTEEEAGLLTTLRS